VCDIRGLREIGFSGLSSLVIEDVADREGVIVVRARTAGGPVARPRCGGLTGQVHGYCARTVADVPAGGRPVVLHVRMRRMRCPVRGCLARTFREQVPGMLDRYQRRTTRLAGQAGEVARRLAGRAGAGLLAALGVPLSRHTALRLMPGLPLPEVAVPRVLGVDDFALRRGQVYATVLIDAETGQRVDVLAGRTAEVLEAWLRGHPGVQVVCRDGPARPCTVARAIVGAAWRSPAANAPALGMPVRGIAPDRLYLLTAGISKDGHR
jgi:transposase